MSTHTIPSAPSIEYYRKQAKALLRAAGAADPTAISRVRLHIPYETDRPFALADAQWVLAREHGFASWPKFKAHLEAAVARPEPELAPEPAPQPTSPARPQSIGTDAVFAKTGRHWDEWYALFDAAGCAGMDHKQIVAVARANGVGPWWQQMVAVEYERERGLRDVNMNCDGVYNVGVSKTIGASVQSVFRAWTEPTDRERWLPGAAMTIRKSTPNKRVLITWDDGGSIAVNLYPKPGERCQVTAEHTKLASAEDVQRYRAFWSAALGRLCEFAEGGAP